MWQRSWLGVVLVLGGTALPAHGQVTLAWKWKVGDKIYLDNTSLTKQSILLMGQAMPAEDTETTAVDSFKVVKASEDEVVLERTIESMKMKSKAPGPLGEVGAKFAEKLQGSVFTVTLDPRQHKITKLGGVDAVIRKITGDPGLQMMAGALNETNIRHETDELITAYLPDKPVKPGDKWKRKSQLSMGPLGGFTLDGEYTYKGQESVSGKTLDRIDVTWTMTFVQPKKNAPVAGMPLQFSKVDIKGESAKGTYFFDAGAGRLVQMERKFTSKGTLTVSAMGQELPLEVAMEQGLTAKAVDKPAR